MTRSWSWWTTGILLMAFCGLMVWIVGPLHPFQDCIQQREGYKAYSALLEDGHFYIKARTFIRLNLACSIYTIDQYQSGVIAISGVVVAWFTGTLWWVTRRSIKAAELAAAAAVVALETSVDTDIARLFAVSAWIDGDIFNAQADRKMISVEVKNFGRTPAFVLQQALEVWVGNALPENLDYRNAEDKPPGTSGNPHWLNFQAQSFSKVDKDGALPEMKFHFIWPRRKDDTGPD